MYVIETKNLTKRYNSLTAVDDLSLQIKEGEIFGLLGPNGAGKTTTLMMLTTLIPPTSGTATINGFDIVKEPDQVRKSIGIVFQDPSSDETLTGYENLKLHGLLYDMDNQLREQRIQEVLSLVELSARQHDVVKKYSGGMRRRLELARGLMHHPRSCFLMNQRWVSILKQGDISGFMLKNWPSKRTSLLSSLPTIWTKPTGFVTGLPLWTVERSPHWDRRGS
jgi:ABC-2 type transport system ATP-binding protein